MPEQKHIETVVLPDSLRQARRAERHQRKSGAENQSASSKARTRQKNAK